MVKTINKKFELDELIEIAEKIGLEFKKDITKEKLIGLIIKEGFQDEVMNYESSKDIEGKEDEVEEADDLTNEGFNENVITIPLHREVTFEKKVYKEVKLDLESLTGADIKQVNRLLAHKGEPTVGFLENNKIFLAEVAAMAMRMPSEFMDVISAPDFSTLTVMVQNFLL